MRYSILFLLFWLSCKLLQGQSSVNYNYINVDDGLPSNHIYKCIQDNRGFLWIASENGLSRFDGQHFRNFTVNDGLPDNEILDIFLDSMDRLWIVPFSKNLAYYDIKKGKIINSDINKDLQKTEAKNGILGNVLGKNKIAIYEYKKNGYIFEGEKINYSFGNFEGTILYILNANEGEIVISNFWISLMKNGVLVKRIAFPLEDKKRGVGFNKVIEKNGALYFSRGDSVIMKITNLDENLSPTIISKKQKFRTWNISFIKNQLAATSRNGNIYFLSEETLEPQNKLDLKEDVKDIMEDKDGNFWVSTDNKGLIKINKSLIISIKSPLLKDNNYTALNVMDSKIMVGNNSGDMVEIKNENYKVENLIKEKSRYNNIIVKKIFPYKQKKIIVSFSGLYYGESGNYKRLVDAKGFKDAIFINDSVLLLGSFNNLYRFNLSNYKLDTICNKRSTTVSVDQLGNYYFGSNDGLYKIQNQKLIYLGDKYKILANNITSIFCTKDNLLWVGMTSDTIVILNKDEIINKISIKNSFKGSLCKIITSAKSGQVWIGTEQSLGRVDYIFNNNQINYTCNYFNKNDGLSAGQINQIAFNKDTVYVSNVSGLYKLYANATPPLNNVPVYITRVIINSKEMDIMDQYELQPNENNIQIDFAGVDLSEYNPIFQYKINNGQWQYVKENTLLLSELAHGKYTIEIRAIKRNGEPSNSNAIIHFNIKTPLLQSIWFWIILSIAITGIVFWLYSQRKLLTQKQLYQQKIALDEQRQKMTADLHDDIGASLSSLQVNSAVANQLLHRDQTKQAKEIIEKIELQSQTIADKIGDIIWSMKPGKDEFMTMSSRIKNFANEILGATNMDYQINIDTTVDESISNITIRKNCVLIIKEAINNIVKYSKATNVNIELKIENFSIIINIMDNGIGFTKNSNSGNGLLNMQKRVEELHGVFELKTEQNKGTSIHCSIPIIN